MNSTIDSNNRQRRHFADADKVAILKRHLIDKVPVSDLCDEFDIYPNQFYDWLKKLFENGHLAFANGRKAKAVEDAQQARIQQIRPSSLARTRSWPSSWKPLPRKKKEMGNSEQVLGPPRHARPAGRFRPLLVGEDRHLGNALRPLARHHPQQVPRLGQPLRQGQ